MYEYIYIYIYIRMINMFYDKLILLFHDYFNETAVDHFMILLFVLVCLVSSRLAIYLGWPACAWLAA